MRTRISLTAALAAVLALGSVGPNIASAAPLAPVPAVEQTAGNGHLIEVASKKKRVYRRNDAAAAAAFAGIAGAIIGLAAQESSRDRYYRDGYYYNGGRHYGRGHYYDNRHSYRGNSRSYQRVPVPDGGPYHGDRRRVYNFGPGPHPPTNSTDR